MGASPPLESQNLLLLQTLVLQWMEGSMRDKIRIAEENKAFGIPFWPFEIRKRRKT